MHVYQSRIAYKLRMPFEIAKSIVGAWVIFIAFYVWSFMVGITTYMTLVSDSKIKHWSLSATFIAQLLTVKCCTLLIANENLLKSACNGYSDLE